ncbi:MAG: sugar transferase, partial [Spirochaetales bacterium]|nr:sugar transferase [Spirochaetales bacterium]
MLLAPIVLFVYNRPDHTRRTLEALSHNVLADQSHLFIFSDGPKDNASNEQLEHIRQTRAVIREKQWCGRVDIIEADKNKGLAQSIIDGVTRIVNEF